MFPSVCDTWPVHRQTTVTFPASERHRPLSDTKLYCLVTEAHRCKCLSVVLVPSLNMLMSCLLEKMQLFLYSDTLWSEFSSNIQDMLWMKHPTKVVFSSFQEITFFVICYFALYKVPLWTGLRFLLWERHWLHACTRWCCRAAAIGRQNVHNTNGNNGRLPIGQYEPRLPSAYGLSYLLIH